jgi:hypothetical protein
MAASPVLPASGPNESRLKQERKCCGDPLLRVDDNRAFPVPWQHLINAKINTLFCANQKQIPDRRFAASGMAKYLRAPR